MTQDFSIPGMARPGVALFVDGENLSHTHAERVVAEAERLGARGVRRVYGDAQKVAKWRDQGTFRIVDCGPGKNAADILLALEALEAALVDGARHVVIASSDGDFAPLALKLAERGVRVTGIGESKTQAPFRKACAQFVELPAVRASKEARSAETANAAAVCNDDALCKVRKELAFYGPTSNGMPLKAFGSAMSQRQKVSVRQLGCRTWRTYLGRYPDVFEIIEIRGDKRVRMRADG